MVKRLSWWVMACVMARAVLGSPSCSFSSSTTCSGLSGDCIYFCDYYQSTTGSGWTTSTSWGDGSDVCTWYGIKCSSSVISALNTYSNNLVGSVPDSLVSITTLTSMLIHDNFALGGTLPSGIFNQGFKFMSYGDSSISGTLHSAMSTSTSLRGIAFWSTLTSGTIPTSLSTITSLEYVLGFNNSVSGTIPFTNPDQPFSALLLETNSLSGTLPQALSSMTSLLEVMVSQNRLTGTIPQLHTSVLHLGISGNDISGTIPSVFSHPLIETFEANNNRLSGTIPGDGSSTAYAVTRLFAVSRNYLTGKATALANANALQTLSLSSNRLTCDMTGLDAATNLAQGSYSPPVVDVLTDVDAALSADGLLGSSDTNIFSSAYATVNNTAYTNMALSWAGNPQLSVAASQWPAKSASRALDKDAVMNGGVPLFSGWNDLKQALCLVAPALFVAHLVVIVYVCHREADDQANTWQHFKRYWRMPMLPTLSEIMSPSLAARMNFFSTMESFTHPGSVIVASSCGAVLMILAAASASVYGEESCVDPLVHASMTAPDTRPHVEWIWLLVVLALMSGATWLIINLRDKSLDHQARSHRVTSVLEGLAYNANPATLIQIWRAAQLHEKYHSQACYQVLLMLAYRLCHIPIVIVLSIPDVLYVMADNSRRAAATGGNFFMVLFGDPTLVALVRWALLVNAAPALASLLARLRNWHHPPGLAKIRRLNTCTLSALVNLQFFVSLAPVLTTFVLDEACLRYYLNFNANVDGIMNQWKIGMTGADAYRENFCSRSLIDIYLYIWFTTSLIQMLGTPSIEIIKEMSINSRLRDWAYQLLSCTQCDPDHDDDEHQLAADEETACPTKPEAWSPDPCPHDQEDPQHHWLSRDYLDEAQISAATFFTQVVLQALVFGIWAPVLLVLMPPTCFLQLRARLWAWRHIVVQEGKCRKRKVGQLAAQTILLDFSMADVARWWVLAAVTVQPLVMKDLNFSLPTIVLYMVGSITCTVVYYVRLNQVKAAHKQRSDMLQMIMPALESTEASKPNPGDPHPHPHPHPLDEKLDRDDPVHQDPRPHPQPEPAHDQDAIGVELSGLRPPS